MSGWLAALAVASVVAVSTRGRPVGRLAAWQSGPARSAVTDGDVPSRPSTAAGWLAVAVIGALIVSQLPVPISVGLGVFALVGSRLRRQWQAARLREATSAAAVEVTFALAGELRAGRTPAQALAAVAPMAGPLRTRLAAAGAAVDVGGDASVELARTAELPGAARLRYVAAAWSVAESAGGRIAVVLERLSESMDADDELRRELEAAMAGPRATMVMLGTLPLLGIALGQAVGAHPLELLVHRPLGWALLAAAIGLDAAGVVATRAIARTALRT